MFEGHGYNEESFGFTNLMKCVLMVGNSNVHISDQLKEDTIVIIQDLIKDPDMLNSQTDDGVSALMIACHNTNTYSNKDVVKMLIDAGSNVNLQDSYGSTALIELCCDFTTCSKIEVVKMLIDTGADVNLQNKDGYTALSSSIDNIEIVKMLVEAGSNINLQDAYGYTPLIDADNIDVIKILIDNGADVNIVSNDGYTALTHKITNFKNVADQNIVLLLNVNHKDDVDLDIVLLLIDAGSNVNHKDKKDRTPLMLLLINYNNCDKDLLVKLIHMSKATLTDEDINGKTAYDYYIKNNNQILDEWQLKLLKGEISLNHTKSARFNY